MEKILNPNECPKCGKALIRDVVREKLIIKCSDQDCFVQTRLEEIEDFVNTHKTKLA